MGPADPQSTQLKDTTVITEWVRCVRENYQPSKQASLLSPQHILKGQDLCAQILP